MFCRMLYALPVIFLWPAASLAQATCSNGLTGVFMVESYEVSEKNSGYSTGLGLDLVLRNRSGRGVRMIDGSIVFQDVLDRDILRIGIDPDMRIEAGETVKQTGIYTNLRLLVVSKEDVLVTTCVRGLVYSDGEVFKEGS